jgi:hypothetical protein
VERRRTALSSFYRDGRGRTWQIVTVALNGLDQVG